MTQAVAGTDKYSSDFAELKARRQNEPQWLRDLREQAFEIFQARGFPVERKGNEDWKYTDIRPIAGATFQYPARPGDLTSEALDARLPFDQDAVRVVVVDGHFSVGLSRGLDEAGIVIQPLTDAVRDRSDLIERNLGRYAEPNHGSFVALNNALYNDGVLMLVEKPVARPVHLVYVTTDREAPVTFPRTLVLARPMSQLTLIETYLSLGEANHFTDPVTEVILEDGAIVRHYRLLLENKVAYHVAHLRTVIGRDASYANVSYETGGGLVRVDIDALLDDEGAQSDLKGLYITTGTQHIDNLVNIDHAKPQGYSRLYYKGILDEKSRAVFGGMVLVRPGADKTDAHQEDKNLILSHEAEVDSKPSLEIYADDVKAGHGATAGAITDDALFYMQSRGIDPEQAMLFLVRGFASEILDAITVDPLREWLEAQTTQALPRFQRES
ncbi:MAG TPA: Fe-S cluster assembly protein SufD [Dehalococcoidia bacterium]|nr:Fe-S cluster assembly protein SufD [Dehalococcoidia bacterium]